MKSVDEVKKGLKAHAEDCCCDCPYWDDCNAEDAMVQLAADALALIQQLEDHLLEATKKVEQLEAERDAAVEDLESYATLKCFACKYYTTELTEAPCNECKIMGKGNHDMFEWRGVQKEDSDA